MPNPLPLTNDFKSSLNALTRYFCIYTTFWIPQKYSNNVYLASASSRSLTQCSHFTSNITLLSGILLLVEPRGSIPKQWGALCIWKHFQHPKERFGFYRFTNTHTRTHTCRDLNSSIRSFYFSQLSVSLGSVQSATGTRSSQIRASSSAICTPPTILWESTAALNSH